MDERSASRRQVGSLLLVASALVVVLAVVLTMSTMPHAEQVRTAAAAPRAATRPAVRPTTTAPAPSTTAAPTTSAAALTDASLASSHAATLHAAVATSTTVVHRVLSTPTTVRPVPVATAPPATAPPTTVAVPPSAAAVLACIRQRESGGNYAAVSANGIYRGAYQFSQATWDSAARHAGRPDLVGHPPNLVAPADQDAVALDLYEWQGLAPWGGSCH